MTTLIPGVMMSHGGISMSFLTSALGIGVGGKKVLDSFTPEPVAPVSRPEEKKKPRRTAAGLQSTILTSLANPGQKKELLGQ